MAVNIQLFAPEQHVVVFRTTRFRTVAPLQPCRREPHVCVAQIGNAVSVAPYWHHLTFQVWDW